MCDVFGKTTLGSDPEIFVLDENGVPQGAIKTGIIGTKAKPQPVTFGAVQVDGLALEYNTDPASTVEDWVYNHKKVQEQLLELCPKGWSFSDKSLIDFTDYIKHGKPTSKELEFGCDPDYNADTMKENSMPDVEDIMYRTAGGHIHIGIENWDKLTGGDKTTQHLMAQRIVFVMDYLLGEYSVRNDIGGAKRRALYGKAGAYRIKPYGVEYRSLSNFWALDEDHMRFMFKITTACFKSAEDFNKMYEMAKSKRAETIEMINKGA